MTADLALDLDRVGRRLDGRAVLEGACLELAPGARLSIAGRSGAGKTTLLRILAGLEAPDSGIVRLHGREASRPGRVVIPPWEREVQMVFQKLALWPTRTVLANVADALRARGAARAAARSQASSALESVGLGAFAARKPASLSGGEARRLAFARALALEPRILLLDEPFSSLDPVARAQGFQFLEEVLERTPAAVILVTHEPAEARALGGSICVLRDGKLTPPAPCQEICGTDEAFRTALEGS